MMFISLNATTIAAEASFENSKSNQNNA